MGLVLVQPQQTIRHHPALLERSARGKRRRREGGGVSRGAEERDLLPRGLPLLERVVLAGFADERAEGHAGVGLDVGGEGIHLHLIRFANVH